MKKWLFILSVMLTVACTARNASKSSSTQAEVTPPTTPNFQAQRAKKPGGRGVYDAESTYIDSSGLEWTTCPVGPNGFVGVKNNIWEPHPLEPEYHAFHRRYLCENLTKIGGDINNFLYTGRPTLSLQQAVDVALKIGDGWRLPSKTEVEHFLQDLERMDTQGFKIHTYSSEWGERNDVYLGTDKLKGRELAGYVVFAFANGPNDAAWLSSNFRDIGIDSLQAEQWHVLGGTGGSGGVGFPAATYLVRSKNGGGNTEWDNLVRKVADGSMKKEDTAVEKRYSDRRKKEAEEKARRNAEYDRQRNNSIQIVGDKSDSREREIWGHCPGGKMFVVHKGHHDDYWTRSSPTVCVSSTSSCGSTADDAVSKACGN